MLENRLILEINSNNLIKNYEYLLNKSQKQMIAVVKANAYGFGILEIVKILNKIGCNYFAVSRTSEINKILSLKINSLKILMLEVIEDFNILKNNKNIEMVVTDLELLKKLLNFGISPFQLHLRLDFGFARSGFKNFELPKLINFINKNNLKFKGIMGHIFSANLKDMNIISQNFTNIVTSIGKEKFEVIHLLNSEGTEKIKCEVATHIRCGQYLFGLQNQNINSNICKIFKLKGIIFDIISIDNLKYIGYSKIKKLKLGNLNRVGQLKIGYGDGFLKDFENCNVLINNKPYKIIHISMDISFVIVDNEVKNGDEVEIFYNLNENEKKIKKSSYEIFSLLNDRINKKVIE